MKNFKWLFACCLIFGLAACVKEEFNLNQLKYELNPEFGIKLATATLNMEDLISHYDENGMIEDSAGYLSLIYRGNVTTINAQEVISVPDQFLTLHVSLTGEELGYLVAHDSVMIARLFEVDFTLDNNADVLDSMQIASADIHINSDFPAPTRGSVSILHSENDSWIWSRDFQDLQPPYAIDEDDPLTNTTLHYKTTATGASALRILYKVTIYAPVGTSIPVFQVHVSLTDINYKGIFGELEARSFSIFESEIDLDLFNSDFDATFGIADPALEFYVANSFGIQAGFEVPFISGYRHEAEVFELQNPFPDLTALVPAAPQPYEEVTANYLISNTSTNPSLSQLMLTKPQVLKTSVDANLASPEGNQSFVMDSSRLKVDMEARFPLYGFINDFHFTDTTEADFDGIAGGPDDPSEVQAATVRVHVVNQLPLDVQVQIYFLDSTMQLLDSLFQQQQPVVQSAPVNHAVSPDHPDYGRTTGTTPATTDVFMDRKKLDKLSATAYIIVDVSGSTTDNEPKNVRIFSEDNIAVALSAKAQFRLTEEE